MALSTVIVQSILLQPKHKTPLLKHEPWMAQLITYIYVCLLSSQSHRHEIHKSHNKAAAQWELREKALKRHLRHPGSPAPLDRASLSIIREVWDKFPNLWLTTMTPTFLKKSVYPGEFNMWTPRCRCSLTSCCYRMCWLALTEPWLLLKTYLEMLLVDRQVESFSFALSLLQIVITKHGCSIKHMWWRIQQETFLQ